MTPGTENTNNAVHPSVLELEAEIRDHARHRDVRERAHEELRAIAEGPDRDLRDDATRALERLARSGEIGVRSGEIGVSDDAPAPDGPLVPRVRARIDRLVEALANPMSAADVRDAGVAIAAMTSALEDLTRLDGVVGVHRTIVERWLREVTGLLELVGPPLNDEPRELARIYWNVREGVLEDLVDHLGAERPEFSGEGLWARVERQAAELRRAGDLAEDVWPRTARRVEELEDRLEQTIAALARTRALVPAEAVTVSNSLDAVRAIASAPFDAEPAT